jgi:uncharacterized Zn finger protein
MAFYNYFGFAPYVSVASRRRRAAREVARLEKQGRQTSPVVIEGRKIAETFWGKSWCDNLERYSDFASRLPRGRSYVRNGSVVDLQITSGRVTALVSGSMMYDVSVSVAPVAAARWRALRADCSGAIDSVIELLQGRFSTNVMTRLCERTTGLFPSPKDIVFTCSCPDWASMCKHVAAVLYGIGARLDHQPELLFTLRRVKHQDLVAGAGADLAKTRRGASRAKVLEQDDLAEVFGIELAPATSVKAKSAPSTDKPASGRGQKKRPNRRAAPKRPQSRLKRRVTCEGDALPTIVRHSRI